MTRCNPYGYATDAGPRHLEGGLYGPEYAGKLTIGKDGIHGVAVCTRPAAARYVMVCAAGHRGPVMDLCDSHAARIQLTQADCCTACVHVPEERAIAEEMNSVMTDMTGAILAGDLVTQARRKQRLDDLRKAMDELNARGISVKRPMRLIEVS